MPRKSATEKPLCYIHDRAEYSNAEIIRRNVCVNDLPLTKHTDEKHYCLFHLPTKEKDIAKFEEVFQSRLDSVKKQLGKIEKLPENERQDAKNELTYDFRYIWFPSKVNFEKFNFKVAVDFKWSIFSSEVDFRSATFERDADFSYMTFELGVGFRLATFSSRAFFYKTTFLGGASFKRASFNGLVEFNEATFEADTAFNSAIFLAGTEFKQTKFFNLVSFDSASFLETSQVFFQQTEFYKTVTFDQAIFSGYISFEGSETNRLFISENALLDLQNARIEKPDKITFHSVRLQPNWFINVDSRKFVFTNCYWKKADGTRIDTKSELQTLIERGISSNYSLLSRTCFQLSDNYEENKSFFKASLFRRMAFESETFGRKVRRKDWLRDFRKVFSDETECKEIFSATVERAKRLRVLLKFEPRPFDLVHSLYYWLSGYGENWFRAFCWLLFIWLFFAILYYLFGTFGDEGRAIMEFGRSLGYSILVMTLQRPEPRPYGWITMILYGFETILAPLQAALLALAIRRKFMR